MKVAIAKAAVIFAVLAAASTNALANSCPADPNGGPLPVCVKPAGEVPEPSSPLLFLAAAAVAGVVLKIRKK